MKAAERRETILDAAELTFAQMGYRGAGMAEIAAAAAVTAPILYRHFASKQELFLAVLTRAIGQIEEAWKAAPGLVEMGSAYTELVASHPHVARLRHMAMAESDPVIQEHMKMLFRRELALIRERADSLASTGLLASGVAPEGVLWLFTALGLLIDASVAIELEEAYSGGIEAAATLFFARTSRVVH